MIPFSVRAEALGWICYAVRAWAASLLALYVAFALNLDAPYWAFITVWVVVQPTVGMQLSKSLYRAVGTVVGTIVGVILIACFAQTPSLFLLALSSVIGITTTLSNLSGNFVSYAHALIGYTAAIVAIGAIPNPESIFFIASARMSCILLGIATVGLVAALFAPHRTERDIRKKLLGMLKDVARLVAFSPSGNQEERSKLGTHLLNEITSANSLIDYASAESGTFRQHADTARSLLTHAIGIITAHRAVEPQVAASTHHISDALSDAYLNSNRLFEQTPAALDEQQIDKLILKSAELQAQVERARVDDGVLQKAAIVSETVLADRLDDLLSHAEHAFVDWRHIARNERKRNSTATLNFHRDHRAALLAGLRAFLAVNAVGLFWMFSAWSYGGNALLIMSVVMSLLSSTPQPALATWGLFLSSIAASICAIVFKFLILSKIEGFETFVILFAIVAIPLGLAMAYPKTSAKINSFALIFMAIVSPTNPMVFKFNDSLNSAVALTSGSLFGVLAYLLIFPTNTQATRAYIFYRVRRGLERLASARRPPSHSAWETRMYDRANRLHISHRQSGVSHDEVTEAALGALAIGNEIIRLRHLAGQSPSSKVRATVQNVMRAFVHFGPYPRYALSEVAIHLEQIFQLDLGAEPQERQIWTRVAGALTEIDRCLVSNPALSNTERAV